MTSLQRLLLAIALLCGLSLAGPTHAGAERPSDDAVAASKKHFQKGETAFALGDFERALGHYQDAYEAAPYPLLLLNIGQCHRNLGSYDLAIFSFRKYLNLARDAKNRAQVQRYIRDTERARDAAAAAARGIGAGTSPAASARSARPTPFYKRWWFIAGATAVATAAAMTAAIRFWPDSGCSTEQCLDFDR